MTCPSHFRWTSSARSDVGRVREINEDACLAQPEPGRWAVADGMGGHAVGDLASRLVIDALSRLAPPRAMKTCIADARTRLQTANRQLRDEAARRQVQRIGSTVIVLLACDRFCGYLWAGDSRLYLYREGQLRQLTRDHSQVQELKALGVITDEEARHHPAQHMITRAVGATDVLELDDDAIEVADGDVFLLCSDGLSNEVSDAEILAVLTSVACERASDELVELAIAHGGRDNVTAVVVQAEDPYASDKTLLNPAP
ncbi:Protein phosphatase PrpC [Paraburkholderia domus]|nr:protein phosphatase 2C domain-containing protein [Paraburkholderia domus]MBK5049088.1 serine/threonine-protein phosphatase [Burkholderia sp. R-70006]MBK5060056.1 serine/threonine-protein phosphatase [Burkholderia sp. R-70199]MBK5085313.1 serine/threonine-protein phosphatase [Burkholderia sp. R-69927]MBK5118318.1 serine/threonine-protein phosphatase [Burkholderia sp. R-69980]MBK5164157.1 serine/threonine-protein phosphatase [Burkholderia sp. R-70211]MBK5179807.1 serine/threonine-protein pho